jgi:hypothetical protein
VAPEGARMRAAVALLAAARVAGCSDQSMTRQPRRVLV